MTVGLKPRTPFLTVEIDIPWEVAELIGGLGIVKAIATALERRKAELAEDTRQRPGWISLEGQKNRMDRPCPRTDAEIAGRSNEPSPRSAAREELMKALR